MRNFIFIFEQSHIIKFGLTTDDLLLLDYFYQFFQEGFAKSVVYNEERYFLIRYSKMIADLPVLYSNERTFRRRIAKLEEKQALKRYIKNRRDLYICVNWKKLFDGD